ncbi:hypothetical protein HGM15179_019776 [Zosterops borbonicus]|uniref:Uncharacterized protein n=1 Tax=Zosterops borbonicus TaxID=364589 RepID=A0A8K1D9Z0_9PASS|nr:hypothetical protein HGM15179_019776 [Zosterops borbonicus]
MSRVCLLFHPEEEFGGKINEFRWERSRFPVPDPWDPSLVLILHPQDILTHFGAFFGAGRTRGVFVVWDKSEMDPLDTPKCGVGY